MPSFWPMLLHRRMPAARPGSSLKEPDEGRVRIR